MTKQMNENNGDSAIIAIEKGRPGRPTKYEPETVGRLSAALADGLTIKQACLAARIRQSTRSAWRERHPELEAQLAEARETARRKALAGIRAAGEAGDWRALEAFLRLSFPADYRKADTQVNVTATAQQGQVVCTEEQRQRLIALREKLLSAKELPPSSKRHPD